MLSIRQWGDWLFGITSNSTDDFRGRAKGVDRRTLIAQGRAHWGNLTGNRDALEAAHRRNYSHAISSIGRGGTDRVWRYVHPGRELYYNNMTYCSAMVTAFALYCSGVSDVYAIVPSGGTLVEGIALQWKSFIKEKPSELMQERAWGSRSPAWAELFVRESPNHPTAVDMEAWLTSTIQIPKFAPSPTAAVPQPASIAEIRHEHELLHP